MRELPDRPYWLTLLVCCREREDGQAACGNRDSLALCFALRKAASRLGLKSHVRIVRSGCLDRCERGPNVAVFTGEHEPREVWYEGVAEADIEALIARHLAPFAERPEAKRAAAERAKAKRETNAKRDEPRV